ncbi:Telomerase reverse transcriptase [Senna tora]|uniref:Telomerase reverse transcriptase n=1 Tax=Senna tora TaxID=362788 RepID=A0A834WCL1_9FABA|nr:Telomerase reverse transcriptase [Senna tora]
MAFWSQKATQLFLQAKAWFTLPRDSKCGPQMAIQVLV